jgi:SNF2 family DNA or RNA helicase
MILSTGALLPYPMLCSNTGTWIGVTNCYGGIGAHFKMNKLPLTVIYQDITVKEYTRDEIEEQCKSPHLNGHCMACFELTEEHLQFRYAIPRSIVLCLAGLTFEACSPMHANLRKLPFTFATILNRVPGHTLELRLWVEWNILMAMTPKAASIALLDAQYTLPITHMGVPVPYGTLTKLVSHYSNRDDILNDNAARHLQSLSILQDYMLHRNRDVYTFNTIPFVSPPHQYIDATLAVQCKLNHVLKDYQIHTIAWALWREDVGYLGMEIENLRNTSGYIVPEQTVSASCESPRKFTVRMHDEKSDEIPTGGCIFEDMGMGKTIEILAVCIASSSLSRPFTAPTQTTLLIPDMDWLTWIKYCNTLPEVTICDVVQTQAFKISGGTLIIVPVSLLSQWRCEIKACIRDDVKLHVHYGPGRDEKTMEAHRHSAPFIVLTTYETVAADSKKKNEIRRSLMSSIEWMCAGNMYVTCYPFDELKTVDSCALQVMDVILSADDMVSVIVHVNDDGDATSRAIKGYRYNRDTNVIDLRMDTATHSTMRTFGGARKVLAGSLIIGRAQRCNARNTGNLLCTVCGCNPYAYLSAHALNVIPPTLQCITWERIVLDESQKIQDRGSQVCKEVCKLKSRRKWCMTGTPTPKDISNLFGQLQFLGKCHTSLSWSKQCNLQLNLLQHCIIRHTKSGVHSISLPIVTNNTIYVQMNEFEKARYYAEYKETRRQVHAIMATSIDAIPYARTKDIMRRVQLERQMCAILPVSSDAFRCVADCCPVTAVNEDCPVCMENSPGAIVFACSHQHCFECLQILLQHGRKHVCTMCRAPIVGNVLDIQRMCQSKLEVSDHEFSVSHCETKLAALAGLLIDTCVPTLIFTQFSKTANVIRQRMDAMGYNILCVLGDMTEKARAASVSSFVSAAALHECPIMVVSLRAASFGLNLPQAELIVFTEPALNMGLEAQAIARVNRLGQTKPVRVVHILYSGTVEERIRENNVAAENTLSTPEDTDTSSKKSRYTMALRLAGFAA